MLLRLTRGERRASLLALAGYLAFLIVLITAAMLIVAHIAGARVPVGEVAIVVWFALGLRLAWEVWTRSLGRLGRRAAGDDSPGAVRPRGWLRRLLPLARGAATCLLLVPAVLAIVLTQRFKLADGTNPQDTLGARYETAHVATRDGGVLEVWFVPERANLGRGAESERTIVICHGAGANKGNFIWFLPPLMFRGYNLVLFDFRAHGGSSGRSCTYGLREKEDVLAVVDWLRRARPAQSRRIVGLGSSLGALALARAAAEDERIETVILDSPFTSPRALAMQHSARVPLLGPALAAIVLHEMSWLTGADFWNDGAEAAVRAIAPRPILIIHGDDDVLMPRSHAQRLFDIAAGPREIWFGPGPHSNIITTAPDEYAERVFAFIAAHE